MAAVSIDLEMKRKVNQEFVDKAIKLSPKLLEKVIKPVDIVTLTAAGQTEHRAEVSEMGTIALKKGDSIILDFGDHQVGYFTMKLKSVGSPQDAPAYLRLKFGEIAKELTEDSSEYDGWISRSWIQEEFLHLDVLPQVITLPRRYAFRYVEIYAIDTSMKFQVVIEEASCRAVASVDMDLLPELPGVNDQIRRMDQVSLRTLQNCMQDVFEDGPKRDRRLWIGDLRLQALANYATFKNFDLVKRCMYLFAGLTREDGAIGACLFTEPEYLVDDTILFDYALFFVSILKDYYSASGELEVVKELWDSAYRQIELSRKRLDENYVIQDDEGFWCFVDWTDGLNKQASAQAIYIYTLNAAIELAGILEKEQIKAELEQERNLCIEGAKKYLWDEGHQVFVSGKDRQISYASQVWMILAGVLPVDESRALINRIIKMHPEKGMVTPYMNHHFVEALLLCGEKEKAMDYMTYYWGGMVNQGADTFWEMYNPENPEESPYGSSMVNSYCHAWSCTPAYILRELL